jgi:hypothetical protein
MDNTPLKQRNEESIPDFYRRVLARLQQVGGRGKDTTRANAYILSQHLEMFRAGMKDERIAFKLGERGPKSLEEAYDHALKLSAFYRQVDNDPRYNSSLRPFERPYERPFERPYDDSSFERPFERSYDRPYGNTSFERPSNANARSNFQGYQAVYPPQSYPRQQFAQGRQFQNQGYPNEYSTRVPAEQYQPQSQNQTYLQQGYQTQQSYPPDPPYSTASATFASSSATKKWKNKNVFCFRYGESGHYKNECTSETELSSEEARPLIASVSTEREECEQHEQSMPPSLSMQTQTIAARYVQFDPMMDPDMYRKYGHNTPVVSLAAIAIAPAEVDEEADEAENPEIGTDEDIIMDAEIVPLSDYRAYEPDSEMGLVAQKLLEHAPVSDYTPEADEAERPIVIPRANVNENDGQESDCEVEFLVHHTPAVDHIPYVDPDAPDAIMQLANDSGSFPTERRVEHRNEADFHFPPEDQLLQWVNKVGVRIGEDIMKDDSWRKLRYMWRDVSAESLSDVCSFVQACQIVRAQIRNFVEMVGPYLTGKVNEPGFVEFAMRYLPIILVDPGPTDEDGPEEDLMQECWMWRDVGAESLSDVCSFVQACQIVRVQITNFMEMVVPHLTVKVPFAGTNNRLNEPGFVERCKVVELFNAKR